MALAMPKNDLVFRRIFAMHPDILNNLFDRWGKQAIQSAAILERPLEAPQNLHRHDPATETQ